MTRFFIELSYHGKNYCGWQVQPGSPSVQESIETALFTILREKIEIIGCGRTDTGVHASQYFAHFDWKEDAFPIAFFYRLNKILPKDIAIHRIVKVDNEAHARFDAFRRAYQYHIDGKKNPFSTEIATFVYNFEELNVEKMQEAARLLLDYQDFAPFCKSNHDAKTQRCELYRSEWEWDADNKKAIYHISANRFLRGMVRLIVGMCLNVGAGKMSIEDVKFALDNQVLLKKANSAEPQGLFLAAIHYPEGMV
jgi:tRNA pseudouridine38-40 synthase